MAKARKAIPEWQRLIERCQKLWEAYDKAPTKKRLEAFGAHLEKMKASESVKVKAERNRGARAFRQQWKAAGYHMPAKKKATKRRAPRKNPRVPFSGKWHLKKRIGIGFVDDPMSSTSDSDPDASLYTMVPTGFPYLLETGTPIFVMAIRTPKARDGSGWQAPHPDEPPAAVVGNAQRAYLYLDGVEGTIIDIPMGGPYPTKEIALEDAKRIIADDWDNLYALAHRDIDSMERWENPRKKKTAKKKPANPKATKKPAKRKNPGHPDSFPRHKHEWSFVGAEGVAPGRKSGEVFKCQVCGMRGRSTDGGRTVRRVTPKPKKVATRRKRNPEGVIVSIKDLPRELREVLGDHKGRDIELIAAESFSPSEARAYGDGEQGYITVVNLLTGESDTRYGDWGGAGLGTMLKEAQGELSLDVDDSVHEIPMNGAIVLGKRGGRYPTARIKVHPKTLTAMLPEAVDVTPYEEVALGIIRRLKSGSRAATFDDIRRGFPDLGGYEASNPVIESLSDKGLVKVSGRGSISITTAGKNVASGDVTMLYQAKNFFADHGIEPTRSIGNPGSRKRNPYRGGESLDALQTRYWEQVGVLGRVRRAVEHQATVSVLRSTGKMSEGKILKLRDAKPGMVVTVRVLEKRTGERHHVAIDKHVELKHFIGMNPWLFDRIDDPNPPEDWLRAMMDGVPNPKGRAKKKVAKPNPAGRRVAITQDELAEMIAFRIHGAGRAVTSVSVGEWLEAFKYEDHFGAGVRSAANRINEDNQSRFTAKVRKAVRGEARHTRGNPGDAKRKAKRNPIHHSPRHEQEIHVLDEAGWHVILEPSSIEGPDEAGINAVKLVDPDNGDYYALITRSARDPGQWQSTRFDERGPVGHSTRDTLIEAVNDTRKWYGLTVSEIVNRKP